MPEQASTPTPEGDKQDPRFIVLDADLLDVLWVADFAEQHEAADARGGNRQHARQVAAIAQHARAK